jgi:hypothetical protein
MLDDICESCLGPRRDRSHQWGWKAAPQSQRELSPGAIKRMHKAELQLAQKEAQMDLTIQAN